MYSLLIEFLKKHIHIYLAGNQTLQFYSIDIVTKVISLRREHNWERIKWGRNKMQRVGTADPTEGMNRIKDKQQEK